MPAARPFRDAKRALQTRTFIISCVDPSLVEEAARIPRVATTFSTTTKTAQQVDSELVLEDSDVGPGGKLVRSGAPPVHLGRYTPFNYLALLGSILAGVNVLAFLQLCSPLCDA
jgi:hypothetical protein